MPKRSKRSKPQDHVPGAGPVTSMAASPSTLIGRAPWLPWVRCPFDGPEQSKRLAGTTPPTGLVD